MINLTQFQARIWTKHNTQWKWRKILKIMIWFWRMQMLKSLRKYWFVLKSQKCDQCKYAYFHRGHLRNHLKTHSREKSNKCNQCNFASSNASALRTHLKTHSGEKTNKCNQCDYASVQKGDLRRHLNSHNGEKSNKCYQCDYSSSEASNLRKQTVEKRRKNATNANMHRFRKVIWWYI